MNSSVESWEPFPEIEPRYPQTYSLYTRLTTVRKLQAQWNYSGSTAVVDHGANPGSLACNLQLIFLLTRSRLRIGVSLLETSSY